MQHSSSELDEYLIYQQISQYKPWKEKWLS